MSVVAAMRVQSQPSSQVERPRQSAPTHAQSLPSQTPAVQRRLLHSADFSHDAPSAPCVDEQVTSQVSAKTETATTPDLDHRPWSMRDTLALPRPLNARSGTRWYRR